MEGFGGQYEVVRGDLTDMQVIRAAIKIQDSPRFDIGENSHIILRGTNTIVGYLGNETLELCCPSRDSPEIYRVPHKHLRRIFNSVKKYNMDIIQFLERNLKSECPFSDN